MTPTVILVEQPEESLRDAIVAPLIRFNQERSGRPDDYHPLALLLRDLESDRILGGLWAHTDFASFTWNCWSCPKAPAVAAWVAR